MTRIPGFDRVTDQLCKAVISAVRATIAAMIVPTLQMPTRVHE
jgi:hypothetical protein